MARLSFVNIRELGIVYSERKDLPIFLVAFLLDDHRVEFGLVPASSKNEAERIGREYGHLIFCEGLVTLLDRVRMFVTIDSKLGLH